MSTHTHQSFTLDRLSKEDLHNLCSIVHYLCHFSRPSHTHTHTHTHSLPQILSEDYENGSATDAGSNSIDIVGVISRSVTAKYSTFCVGSVVYKQFITV